MSREDKETAKATADEPEVEAAGGSTEPADAVDGGGEPAADATAGSNKPPVATAGNAAQPHVSPIDLAQLEPGDHAGNVGNLELLRDIELSVTVEVGRARLRVRDLLALHEGSIVELDRQSHELLDIMANGTLIAKGEVVTVNGRFGIRVVEVVAADARLAGLERRK
jgi:flagellar motor switch protein FliN/FliY